MMIHNAQTPKLPTDLFECHGVKMTYVDAVEKGLVTLTLNDDGEIVHLQILSNNLPGYVTEGEITEGAQAGTTFKQS
jgi:hypothetical protein